MKYVGNKEVTMKIVNEVTMKKMGFLISSDKVFRDKTLFSHMYNGDIPNCVSYQIAIYKPSKRIFLSTYPKMYQYTIDFEIKGIFDNLDEDSHEFFSINNPCGNEYYQKIKDAIDRDLLDLQKVGIVTGFKNGMPIPFYEYIEEDMMGKMIDDYGNLHSYKGYSNPAYK